MLKCKINVRYWLWSVVESILVSNCHYLLSSLFRTIRHYLQLFVSIWNYSICHFSLLFATIQLLFATSFHHSRLTTRIRSCILDMDDLSHTICDYSGVFVLFATMCYSIVPDIYLQSGIVIRFDNLDQPRPKQAISQLLDSYIQARVFELKWPRDGKETKSMVIKLMILCFLFEDDKV